MDAFAVSFDVDLVPDSALAFSTTLFVLLLLSYIFVRGTVAVGDKLTPRIWPSMAFFAVAMVAILYSQARDEGEVVRFSAETDRVSVEVQQDGAVQDSFSHSGPVVHDHDGYGPHTHP